MLKEYKAIRPIARLRNALQEMNSMREGGTPMKTWQEVRSSLSLTDEEREKIDREVERVKKLIESKKIAMETFRQAATKVCPEYVRSNGWDKVSPEIKELINRMIEDGGLDLAGVHFPKKREPRDGEPCEHPGCLSHRTHPCEGCGRIAGGATQFFRANSRFPLSPFSRFPFAESQPIFSLSPM